MKHYIKSFLFMLTVAMVLNVVLATTARAEDVKRGDLKAALIEASTDQGHAEMLLKLELNKPDVTQDVANN